MLIQPKLEVTGYRGIWGESLTTEIVEKYGRTFAQFTKENSNATSPTVLIGRDGRESGILIAEILTKEFEKFGISTINGDILPTPTILLAVQKHKYDGAIIITASHNPIEYNGLKFVTKDARLTNEAEVEKMKKFL
ncbi:MAG: hypothetical protein WC264_01685 [Candidatus Paceibacterota bacterium]|jgi:phosphomannomutase